MNNLRIVIEIDNFIVEEWNGNEVEYAKMYPRKDFTIGQAVEDYYNNIFSKSIEENTL